MANLTPVGVQAVVEGLTNFTSGMSQMQSGMQKTGEAAERSAGPFASLSTSISRAEADFASLGQQLITGAIVGGIGAVTAAFTGLVAASKVGLDSLVAWGEQLDRLGDQFGMTGEQASMWTVAMNRVGLSVEEGGAGLNYFTRNLDNVKSEQELASASTAKQSDSIEGLNQKLADAQVKLQRTQQTLAEAEKPTNAMRWAVEDAQKAVNRYSEELATAQSGTVDITKSMTPFQKAMNTLGIDVFDATGKVRTMDDMMPDIMDKFQAMPAGVNSTAIAMDLFGARGGTKFLDFLRQGSAGLRDSREMAKAFGLEMSTDGMNSIEEYGFALNELNLGFTGIKNQIGMAVLPYVRQFIGIIGQAIPSIVELSKTLGEKLGAGLQVVVNMVNAFQSGGLAGGLTALFGEAGGDVGAFFDNLISDISNLASIISSVLVPAFNWIIANALPMMSSALGFVNENWDAFSGAIIGIGAVLAGAVIVGGIAAIAGAIASLVTPVGLIIAAAALLGAAWNTNFLGIRDALTAFWAVAQPIAAEFVAWYGGQMVAGIQQLTAIWNSVLLPAFQAASTFIQSSVIPAIQQVYTWLATNIPAAIQAASGYWNGVLLPAMQAVGNWINAYLTPAIMALNNFMGAVLNVTLTAAAGLWQNVLYPALLTVYNFLSAQLTPALTTTSTTISGVLGPVVDVFVNGALVAFQQGLLGIQNALTWVTQKLNELSSGLNSVQLPDWLKPGSPTPFEMGLRGIADTLEGKVAKALEGFSATAPATFKTLADSVVQIKDNLAAMAEDTLVKFGEAMNSVGSAMVSNFTESNSAADRLADGMNDLRNSMSGISGTAQNIGNAFSSLNEAGNNIYNTLIPALQSLVGWLNNVAEAAADAAENVGNVGGAASGAGGPGFAAGVRNFVVPPGFPNDTYPVRLTSGERVTVVPRSGTTASGGMSVTVNFGDVAINNDMDLAELGMFVERSVVQALGA